MPRMYRMVRYFLLASLLALMGGAALLSLIARNALDAQVLRHGSQINAQLGRVFVVSAWSELRPRIEALQNIERGALVADPATAEIAKRVAAFLHATGVVKLAIADRRGRLIYSTERGEIGDDIGDHPAFAALRSGGRFSELDHLAEDQASEHSAAQPILLRSVLAIPPAGVSGGDIEAFLLLTSDVTATYAQTREEQRRFALGALGIFLIIYLVLVLFVHRAECTIRARDEEIEYKQRELTEKNAALATEVEEREHAEQALRELNDTLEERVELRTEELKCVQNELLQQEKLATMGHLIATVSHELRNPLATIRNSIYAIEMRAEGKELDLERPLGRIARGLNRCDGIISELLDYTRNRKLNLERVEFDAWLQEVIAEQDAPAGIEVHSDLAAAGAQACIERDRFRRVVINLFDNACQAMVEDEAANPRGTRRLEIETRLGEGMLQLVVRDEGPGITADNLARIFEPLFTTKRNGFGLGLAVVKQIVEQHSGFIDMTSEVDRGTTVKLRLPLSQVGEKAA